MQLVTTRQKKKKKNKKYQTKLIRSSRNLFFSTDLMRFLFRGKKNLI